MQRLIFIYGAIGGLIVIISFIVGMALMTSGSSLQLSQLLGYLIMIVAFSTIFLAIKRYRDEVLGGVIKFSTAFKLGIGITLVASAIYVVGWEINLLVNDYDFMGQYTEQVMQEKKAEGLTEAELDAEMARIEDMQENYKNPLFRLPITFLEIFPVGLIVTLISSLLLRNSRFLATV